MRYYPSQYNRGDVLELDGVNDYAEGNNNYYSDIQTLGLADYTVSMWVYPRTLGGKREMISIRNPGENYHFRFALRGSSLSIYRSTFNAYNQAASVVTNKWQHIVILRDSQIYYFYLDGSLLGSEPVNPGYGWDNYAASEWKHTKIGAFNASNNLFDGYLDDIIIQTKAISTDEIKRRYLKSNGGSPTDLNNLVAYYKMNKTGGGLLEDESVNGYNLNLLNGADTVNSNNI